MNRCCNVFCFELKRQGRRRAYLFTTFGVPLIAIVLLLGYQMIQESNQGSAEETPQEDTPAETEDTGPIGYVDHSGLFPSPGLFGTGLLHFDSEDEARAAAEAGDID